MTTCLIDFSHACICLYTQNLHDYVRRYVYINKKSICIYICLIMFVFIERHFAWRWIRYPSLFSLWRLNSTKGAATVEHFAGGTDKKRSLVVSPSFFCVMIICCHKMCHRWIIYCIFLYIYIYWYNIIMNICIYIYSQWIFHQTVELRILNCWWF